MPGPFDLGPLKPAKTPFKPMPNAITPQPTVYLEPSFADHYNAWKTNPGSGTMGALITKIDPVINEAIRTYGAGATGSPTLRSKAKKLAISAINNYDPTRAKLRTHLLSQLQGLRRLSAKEEQILSIPEQVLLDLGGLRGSENRLKDKLGRDPSDIELADHTGLSMKRIGYLRTIRPSFAEGRLVRVDDEGTSISQPAVEQRIGTGTMNSWHEFVYHDLDPIDQQIMEHTLGLHNKPLLSNQGVAKKLRLSPGAISQRKARIQDKLDQFDSAGVV